MDMEGAVAIVTGSSSGVGAACARQLAEKGAHVVINYSSNAEGAEATRAACEAFGVETAVVRADVAEDEDCRSLAQTALDRWGRIDALVNNAGTTKFLRPRQPGRPRQGGLPAHLLGEHRRSVSDGEGSGTGDEAGYLPTFYLPIPAFQIVICDAAGLKALRAPDSWVSMVMQTSILTE